MADAAVRYGMPKDELVKELGAPSSTVKSSDREILMFPKSVRIELENNLVVAVKGLDIAAVEAATKKVADDKAAAEAQALHERETEEKVQAALAEAAKAKPPEAAATPKSRPAVSAWFDGKKFSFDVVLKALLLVVFLRFTTNYWSVKISSLGLVLASLADAVVRSGLLLAAVYGLRTDGVFLLDQLLATIALVLVLHRMSATKLSWQQAGKFALTAKACAFVLGAIATALIFHAAH